MELSTVLIRKLDSGPADLTEEFKQHILLHVWWRLPNTYRKPSAKHTAACL